MGKIKGNIEFKTCPRCHKTYKRSEEFFYKTNKKWDGLYVHCKECHKAIRRERAKTGKETRDKANEYARRFKERHKERLKVEAQEYLKTEKGKLYHAKGNAKRRAKTQIADSTLTIKQWEDCRNYFRDEQGNLRCAYCDKIIYRADKEHFIPLSKGGEFTINNILPSCKTCNSSKGDKDFFEWYPKQKFYSVKQENKILKYLNIKNESQQLRII